MSEKENLEHEIALLKAKTEQLEGHVNGYSLALRNTNASYKVVRDGIEEYLNANIQLRTSLVLLEEDSKAIKNENSMLKERVSVLEQEKNDLMNQVKSLNEEKENLLNFARSKDIEL